MHGAYCTPVGVIVPGSVAAELTRLRGFTQLAVGALERDRDLADVLYSIAAQARIWEAEVEMRNTDAARSHIPALDVEAREAPSSNSVVIAPPSGWLSVESAAAALQISPRAVRARAERGHSLRAVKVGGAWFIDPASVPEGDKAA